MSRDMILASIKLAAKVAPNTSFFEVTGDNEMALLMAFFDPFTRYPATPKELYDATRRA